MNKELNDLVQYRIARAKEALEEAGILAASGHWNACVNRLYYACFYAVSGLLSKHDLSSSKHSGVRSFFNQHFVKTGIISKETALIYNSLFERRQESDYEVFVTFEETDVKPWFNEVEVFLNTIIKLV
ncbi:MAG: HEPN domain-containing protein [Desulfobacterales bacterium]|nr:HEPN domain-containing protein [Desulfobacterales bacterium]